MSLFESTSNLPLAKRMSPKTLDQYEGQEHLISSSKPIRVMLETNNIQSMIFYGSPASGKTALAELIATKVDADFVALNALDLNLENIKSLINHKISEKKTVIFIDEIHRLTRPKQDVFLEPLELGKIVLLGATTENPMFLLQPALRSRLLIFEFFPLDSKHLKNILIRALKEDKILSELNISLEQDAEEFLIHNASDPRHMLTILETALLSKPVYDSSIKKEDIQNILQKPDTAYNSKETHYHIISAFIKSIRGSDPDAALYYLALMIESGEDPQFIFRRLLILSVEDIGLAYPEAVVIIQSCADAFDKIGLPEGKLFLSHAVLLLSGLPKSDSVLSINKALNFIEEGNILPIPKYLQNHPFNSSIHYKNPHDFSGSFVNQKYLSRLVSFYEPKDLGFEKKIREHYLKIWKNRYQK